MRVSQSTSIFLALALALLGVLAWSERSVLARAIGIHDGTLSGKQPAVPLYTWSNVPMGGGGYVTGVAVHPVEPDLAYIRTDVGGAYRWNEIEDSEGRHWVPLNDNWRAEEANYYGIESLALDPADPDRVYIAAGKYLWAGNGRLFASDDRGATWRPLDLELPMGANDAMRASGERLVVDPNETNVLYYGSRYDGLFKSSDFGETWAQIAPDLPLGDPDLGVTALAFDPFSEVAAGSPTPLLAAIHGQGVFRSTDGGQSWTFLDGGPIRVFRLKAGPGGRVFASARRGLFRYQNGVWDDASPQEAAQIIAVTLDPSEPGTVIAALGGSAFNQPIFLSRDWGETWREYTTKNGRISLRSLVPWLNSRHFGGAIADLAVDPHRPGRLWLADWMGVWIANNYAAKRMTWRSFETGREEMVAMSLMTPPIGAPLFTGTVDTNGFRHSRVDQYPLRQLSDVGIWNSFGFDFHERNPALMVRVGTRGPHDETAGGTGGFSTDNGRTWKAFSWEGPPPMKIAYSAEDPKRLVALGLGGTPQWSADLGQTWRKAEGVEATPIETYWHWDHPLAADRVDGEAFYLHAADQFWVSRNGGKSFDPKGFMQSGGRVFVEAEPGAPGTAWVSLDHRGLHVTRDYGETFATVRQIDRSLLFSLGVPEPGSAEPTLFVYGQLQGQSRLGLYRSTDGGRNWIDIGDPAQPVGNEPTVMRGDRQVFGRVFVGTNGRGVFVGTPR